MRSLSRLAILVGVLVGVGAVPAVAAAQSNPSLPAVVSSSTFWQLRDSLTTGPPTLSFNYGHRPQVPIMGDWDGDGERTPGAYVNGQFLLNIQHDGSTPEITFVFGDPRGFPVVGDYNGDATEDVAVYRHGLWQVRLSTGDTYTFTFGHGTWPHTSPVAGDWDGDGIDGVGTYTYSTAMWGLRNSPTGNAAPDTTFAFGTPNASYPVPGDWDGDGNDTVGVKTGTTWTLRNSNTPGPPEITFEYGLANDLPLTWKPGPTPRQLCDQQLAAAGLSAPPSANYILGIPGDDDFSGRMTAGNDVVCGFGGNDTIWMADFGTENAPLRAGDIFLGGDGKEFVHTVDGGTFNGGDGNEYVGGLRSGTVNGGPGNDRVENMFGGTFNGGDGDDVVVSMRGGTFNGGDGDDAVVGCKFIGITDSVEHVSTLPCP